jgi:hypothetical protein
MVNSYSPAIVVVAFNRPNSLKRILSSLAASRCEEGVKLIISIDNDGYNQEVFRIASEFVWSFGEKDVIYHEKRLGLRNHVLQCGDLSYTYGSIIMLEDDLVVSPYFYKYAVDAIRYYENEDKIGGISLYNLPYTESSKLPFIPLNDDSDVYFKQVPSSLGQCWTENQWDLFKKWYVTDPDLNAIEKLPSIVKIWWPESSWKKYFYGYLITTDKYFVFPRVSLTTNFNDAGTNMRIRNFVGQVQLKITSLPFRFQSFEDSISVYDSYSEIIPNRLNRLTDILSDYTYEVDLYGLKDHYATPFVLTSKPCKSQLFGFERSLKPHELNIIMNLKGDFFKLARVEDVLNTEQKIEDYISDYSYFYTNVFSTDKLIDLLKFRLKNKLKSILGRGGIKK